MRMRLPLFLALGLLVSCSAEEPTAAPVDTTIAAVGDAVGTAGEGDVAGRDTEFQPDPNADPTSAPSSGGGYEDPSSHPSFATLDFATYRTGAFGGPTVMPDFDGEQSEDAMFATRLTEAARSGPNFAGRYAVAEIGCGAGCRFVYVINLANGSIAGFPLGGEENLYLELAYRPDSALVLARYLTYGEGSAGNHCTYKSYVWSGADFKELTSATEQGECF